MTQLSLLDALDARDRALAQVEENSGPDFTAQAREFVLEFHEVP